VEDVVEAVVAAGFFDRGDVGGLFDDADLASIAGGTGAVETGIDVGDVVAEGAEAERGFEGADGVGEGVGVGVRRAQDVEGEALRGARADTGELAEFVDEPRHGSGEAGGHGRQMLEIRF